MEFMCYLWYNIYVKKQGEEELLWHGWNLKKVKSYEHKSKEGERALLSQLEKGKKLSESDLCSLVQCYCVEEATTDIDRIALREYVRTISKLGDRFFATDWERGLKDFDDLYYMQPFEVQLEEYEKTIKVREWNEK